jgi:UDP-N-acetylmuramate--alanine ligase
MYKKIFFCGIGGIGMSALARYYMDIGVEVWGSDSQDSQIIQDLIQEGANISLLQDGLSLDESFDLFIYTVAVDDNNPEFIKAKVIKDQKQKNNFSFDMVTYGQALSNISKDKKVIAISGTDGKTTTTAMTFYALKQAGLNISMIIGSLIEVKDDSGYIRKSNYISHINKDRNGGALDYIIIEACEYKRTFLNYNPNIILITNIGLDHIDYYKDLNDIEHAFQQFVDRLTSDGIVICHQSEFAKISHTNKVNADIVTKDIDFQLSVFGEYNRDNARLVLAMCQNLGLNIEQVKLGLLKFKGTWRRQEYKGERWGYICYDDYAHNPIELEVTIKSFREKYKDKTLNIAFMPHLFSRTKIFFDNFVDSLSEADNIILLPIYAAREAPDPSINSSMIVNSLLHKFKKDNINKTAFSVSSISDLKSYLENNNGNNNVFITFGAGNIGDVYK